MTTESELQNDPRYQCWCGINAEKAAFVIAIVGAIVSGLSLAIVPLIAYICIIVAIKTKNPSLYTVFFVVVIFAVAMYVVFIIMLLVAIDGGTCTTEAGCFFAIVVFVVSLLFQIWVIWVVYKAYMYTKAVRERGRAHCCQTQPTFTTVQVATYASPTPAYASPTLVYGFVPPAVTQPTGYTPYPPASTMPGP